MNPQEHDNINISVSLILTRQLRIHDSYELFLAEIRDFFLQARDQLNILTHSLTHSVTLRLAHKFRDINLKFNYTHFSSTTSRETLQNARQKMEIVYFLIQKSPVSPLSPLKIINTLYNGLIVHHSGAEASLLFQVGAEASFLFQPGAEYSSARFPTPS